MGIRLQLHDRVNTDLVQILVPKLYLGTELREQLNCEVFEAQLPGQSHSQVQLGNEKGICLRGNDATPAFFYKP